MSTIILFHYWGASEIFELSGLNEQEKDIVDNLIERFDTIFHEKENMVMKRREEEIEKYGTLIPLQGQKTLSELGGNKQNKLPVINNPQEQNASHDFVSENPEVLPTANEVGIEPEKKDEWILYFEDKLEKEDVDKLIKFRDTLCRKEYKLFEKHANGRIAPNTKNEFCIGVVVDVIMSIYSSNKNKIRQGDLSKLFFVNDQGDKYNKSAPGRYKMVYKDNIINKNYPSNISRKIIKALDECEIPTPETLQKTQQK